MQGKTFFAFIFILISHVVEASLCLSPSPSRLLGKLDKKIINEASGLAISRKFKDRFYHINDSGDGPYFYTTDGKGGDIRSVEIEGFVPRDVEDLALGPCFKGKTCLVIGDMGDNAKKRKSIEMIFIEEDDFDSNVRPLQKLTLVYPDHAHDAEGLALHPNGDLYILTKEMSGKKKGEARSAILFKLEKEKIIEGGEQKLEKVATLDLPSILGDYTRWGKIVTALDFSPNGRRMLVLTYQVVIEVAFDPTEELKPVSEWERGRDFTVIPTEVLPQQEAIAYLPDGSGFVYDTESKPLTGNAPIYEIRCD